MQKSQSRGLGEKASGEVVQENKRAQGASEGDRGDCAAFSGGVSVVLMMIFAYLVSLIFFGKNLDELYNSQPFRNGKRR